MQRNTFIRLVFFLLLLGEFSLQTLNLEFKVTIPSLGFVLARRRVLVQSDPIHGPHRSSPLGHLCHGRGGGGFRQTAATTWSRRGSVKARRLQVHIRKGFVLTTDTTKILHSSGIINIVIGKIQPYIVSKTRRFDRMCLSSLVSSNDLEHDKHGHEDHTTHQGLFSRIQHVVDLDGAGSGCSGWLRHSLP